MKRFLVLFFICLISANYTALAHAHIRYVITPESPRPGEPVTIAVNVPLKEAVLFVNGRQVGRAPFFTVPGKPTSTLSVRHWLSSVSLPQIRQPGFMAAILTIPATVDTGGVNPVNALIRLTDTRGVSYEIPIKIAHREFRSETIHLTPALTSLVADPNPQRTAESQRLWEILSTTGDKIYHTDRFVLPTSSTRRTSQFGSRRVNQYSDGRRVTSIHAGIDFGIPTGTEVWTSGRGRVVLARMRIVSGYSVIIEHLPGVYSIYYHLDSIIAQEGAIVEAGEVIGLSGSTGFSTGPHLHWELRVNSENTDPDAFVARPLIDKDYIISRIFHIEH